MTSPPPPLGPSLAERLYYAYWRPRVIILRPPRREPAEPQDQPPVVHRAPVWSPMLALALFSFTTTYSLFRVGHHVQQKPRWKHVPCAALYAAYAIGGWAWLASIAMEPRNTKDAQAQKQ